jgi:hypothetical protein
MFSRLSGAQMVADLDIWRTANVLLREHGQDALTIAAQRRDKLLDVGDVDGVAVWRRIMTALEELRRTRPANGEHRH